MKIKPACYYNKCTNRRVINDPFFEKPIPAKEIYKNGYVAFVDNKLCKTEVSFNNKISKFFEFTEVRWYKKCSFKFEKLWS